MIILVSCPYGRFQSSRYTKYIQALEEITTEGGDHELKSLCRTKICRKRRRHNAKFKQKRLYNHNIVTKADKGGAVIIVDVDDYVQEANQQLDNKDFYKNWQ